MFKIKRLLIILTVFLLLNPISSTRLILADENEAEESFIEIENSDGLVDIEKDLTKNYVLIEDIDLIDVDWEPIDTGEFTGKLIGNEFKIRNMSAKYIADENLGLFTYLENGDNVDVEVEFVEEVEEPQEEVEEKEEIPEEKDFEEIAPQREEPEQEEEALKKDSKDEEDKSTQNRAVVSRDVYNNGELKSALEDSSVTEINLMGDISRNSSLTNRIDIAPREVVINGNGHELKQTAGGLGITSYAMFRAESVIGKKTKVTFRNVDLISLNGNSIISQKGTSVDWEVVFEDVNAQNPEAIKSKGMLVNGGNAHVKFKETVNFKTDNNPIIADAQSVTIDSEASVAFETDSQVYETAKNGAKLHIKSGGGLFVTGSNSSKSAIEFKGDNSEILVEGKFMIGSKRRVTGTTAGLIKLAGDYSEFNVVDGGRVGFSHTEGSILYMSSENGQVNVSGKGTNVQFLVQEGNGDHDAPIHFNRANNYHLNVFDGALFEVTKEGGLSMGIRVGQGTGHQINVTDGSKFKIHNKGNGQATDPDGEKARNQALFYYSDFPEFNLEGAGSEVELIADNGAAMDMAQGGKINAGEGTTFIARGKSLSANRGIIVIGDVKERGSMIQMTNPAFYDFRNENTEGFVFHTGRLARIEGFRTDIALWARGKDVNLDGPHNFRFLDVFRYAYMHEDFKTISVAATTSAELREVHAMYHPQGLREFARISGNNAEAVVDEIYIPTDADQKIYAHVTVDEGMFGKRDAYTDEAEVDIEHMSKVDGTVRKLQGKTIGGDQFPGEDAYEIYGKPVDPKIGAFGWVEIKLPSSAYLEAGDTLKLVGARVLDSDRAGGKWNESDLANSFQGMREVVDVTPPSPTEIIDSKITDNSRSFKGTLTEKDAVVSVEVNGSSAGGTVEYDRDNSIFMYTFNERLRVGDEVQVFLSDNVGIAEGLGPEADRPNRPETNKDSGNINPNKSSWYHDKPFYQAPLITVTKEGALTFTSVPAALNFNVKVKPHVDEYLVNLNDLGNDLIVSDTRRSKSKWELSARMSKQLTAIDDDKLMNALVYRNEHEEVTINDANQIITYHEYESSEDPDRDWNLSSHWGQGSNGLFIKIEPGVLKKDYVGEVTWTLSDTP